MPWYSVPAPLVDALIAARHFGMKVCYLRDGDRVFETYWTTGRGCEVMGNSYGMLDMTVYGRQEPWEDSPRAGHAARGLSVSMGGRPRSGPALRLAAPTILVSLGAERPAAGVWQHVGTAF